MSSSKRQYQEIIESETEEIELADDQVSKFYSYFTAPKTSIIENGNGAWL